MKPIHALAVALPMVLGSSPDAQSGPPFWQKTWTVTAIEGATSIDRASLSSTIGLQIVMKADALTDPLAEDCTRALSYDDIKSRPIADLNQHFGANWTWPSFSGTQVTYGWVRCDGSNVGAFAFVDPQKAYLFYEAGAILVLK
ncbi:hypothetical protein UCD39_27935 [Nitrospirillum sp. BR 11752]|uniref:Uncharacterized protein n=1 Tax=Nitrospirillum amazonense TaxID=28077 RepID=A0A560GSR1_9PROT|nr:hypothetical protein [Nitrospirillum amazonense]MEE3627760.1 hypothetical protein [Nitrospirillum sp. BR 11752]TWB36490.1 hypothetical protein FBZ90_11751 [Nitrospirillum amazonense]